jgi:glucosamine--fructose-6-phosphate aminotransferase (isomerizing)
MCGIVGYTGNQEAGPIILNGLKKLEYRGYDSAGICTMDSNVVEIRRSLGKLVNLEHLLSKEPVSGTIGIGHTRWATHGRPSEINAHPHRAGSVVVVHNGIIENYHSLRAALEIKGHQFKSETDTEVISHLIDEKLKTASSFEDAVRKALMELRGSYALCILNEKELNTLIAAKLGSPMVVGVRGGEFFVASDIPAILSETRDMVFMEDGEMVVLRNGMLEFCTITGLPLQKQLRHIDWSADVTEKSGYPHFMLKEIHEQPKAIRETLAGRLLAEDGDVFLEDLGLDDEALAAFEKVFLIACGTSWHAALVGKYLIEEHCRIPVEVDIASEFRYRDPLTSEKTLIVLISQSGETADTLAALREGKRKGGKVVALCNVVGSSIAREADGVIYTRAGLEIGVASTKAFVTQLVALYLLAIRLGRARGIIDRNKGRELITPLQLLPRYVEEILELGPRMEKIAREYLAARNFLYLGRGINYPIALEGALKLKEISYIHAEGYPAGEMKHGPIALIDSEMPVVILATRDRHYEKVVSNMEEVCARGGRVIALCSQGDSEIHSKAECVIEIPMVSEIFTPLLLAVPLQFLAYHIAVLNGKDVDQPRNLAKSVTVE